MKNGQTKPEYHLQIATKNQFITDFGLFPNPTDTLTLIPLLYSYKTRYGHLASTIVADLGYDSEGNYHFMDPCEAKPYVEYNRFHLEHRPDIRPIPFIERACITTHKKIILYVPWGNT